MRHRRTSRLKKAAPLAVAAAVVAGATGIGWHYGPVVRASHATAVAPVAEVTPTPTASPSPTGYSRDAFGKTWADLDKDGCDTRQEVVDRDTTDKVHDGKCKIPTATLLDPYTGESTTGATSKFQVDHVVALADSWRSGADEWTPEKRLAFANDPAELALTTAKVNASKNDRGPDEWAPVSKAAACVYGRRYTAIKFKWGLTFTPSQRKAVNDLLDTCYATHAP